jgi:cardiolipin synthase A/B
VRSIATGTIEHCCSSIADGRADGRILVEDGVIEHAASCGAEPFGLQYPWRMWFHPTHSSAGFLVALAYVVIGLVASLHALLTKPDPRSALAWMSVAWLLPFGGPVLYGLFGINRVRRPRVGAAWLELASPPESVSTGASGRADLARVADALTGRPLVTGNELEPLENGAVAFPRMLRAIEAARSSVWLATYIFQTDAVGKQFVQALSAASRRGVQVRVLVDGIGEWYDWPHAVPLLRRAGVRAERFLAPRLIPPQLSLNCRNHRKILVVDGRWGFMGGMNIGGRELGTGGGMSDMHFHLHGPIVRQLARTFAEDWAFATREPLTAPALQSLAGECTCRVITGGPDEDLDKLLLVILGALANARRRVQIMTPYFIPPPELVAALEATALRGVVVSLVLPERSNLRYVDWATQHWLPALIARGVRVHLQKPPFSHAKLFVVDGEYAHIGSVNVDTRSLRLNFEITVEVYDADFCGPLAAFIEERELASPALAPHTLPDRSAGQRVRDALCWLISPYL